MRSFGIESTNEYWTVCRSRNYHSTVIASVEKLIVSLETLYDILTSVEKLGQVVDMDMETDEGKTPNLTKGLVLELNDVSYSVADREDPILSNIHLKVPEKVLF